MSENIRYMSRSILRSQSRPPVSNTDVMYFLFSSFTSFMITRIPPAVLLLFLFLGPSVSATSASSLKNVLCLHLNCPCVSLTEVSEHSDKKCREWYTVFYTAYMQDFQYCRLAGDGRVSYTNCKRNTIQHDPSFIASIIMSCCVLEALIVSILYACRILLPEILWFFQSLMKLHSFFMFYQPLFCAISLVDASQQTNFLDIVFSCSQVSSLLLSLIICWPVLFA